MHAVALGIGNTLLSDEGIGVRAVEAFQRRYRLPDGVRAIDGGTAGMDLLADISALDFLLVFDAIVAGQPPGTMVRLSASEVPAFLRRKLSPHQIGLSDVLASLELLGAAPKDMLLLGVQPERLTLGMELSPVVAARLPDLVATAGAEFAVRGVTFAAQSPSVEVA